MSYQVHPSANIHEYIDMTTQPISLKKASFLKHDLTWLNKFSNIKFTKDYVK